LPSLFDQSFRVSNQLNSGDFPSVPLLHGVAITGEQPIDCGFVVGELACGFRSSNGYFSGSIRAGNLEVSDETVTLCCANPPAWTILHES
jgi:hypothetical protein